MPQHPHHDSSSGEPHFPLAVDADYKATEFRPFTAARPHMLAFHLAWLNLFACFFSTFSIPPLLPIISADLNLSPSDMGLAGSASFAGSILSRFLMGPTCDLLGPRVASAALSLLTAPIILATSLVSTPNTFIAVRFLFGFSLANFVSNQFWMTSMFSPNTVAVANAVAAGWANVGSGVTQLLMPLIYSLTMSLFNVPSSTAWRLAFIVPALFQTFTGILVLAFGQDQPLGNYTRTTSSPKGKKGLWKVLLGGLGNYRGWVMGALYAASFGVELTVDNVIAGYFYERFGLDVKSAGSVAACFGMANVFSRPLGGVVSDRMGKRFGVRGRLWALWVVQTVAGFLCVLLGRVDTLVSSVLVMCCFSLFVQAASGLVFGVVPFVSKRCMTTTSTGWSSGTRQGLAFEKLQITRSNIRNDRERRNDRGCCHSTAVVFGHKQHVEANKHIPHGPNDDIMFSSCNLDLLPSVGRHVLWPFP
ncbi:High affinity nitrate transporter 2.7 [Spatholobus suberectus]|nr:High affinity nitrate transporter 2.7 [Spatholobus suberectus]